MVSNEGLPLVSQQVTVKVSHVVKLFFDDVLGLLAYQSENFMRGIGILVGQLLRE